MSTAEQTVLPVMRATALRCPVDGSLERTRSVPLSPSPSSTCASGSSLAHDGVAAGHHSLENYHGWLWKEGDGFFAEFKRRYFVLEKSTLRYYTDDPSAQPKAGIAPVSRGTVDLRGSQIRTPKSARRTKEYTIRIDLRHRDQYQRRKYILAADSDEIRSRWMTRLRQAAAGTLMCKPESHLPAKHKFQAADASTQRLSQVYPAGTQFRAMRDFTVEGSPCAPLRAGQVVTASESKIGADSQIYVKCENMGWYSLTDANGDMMLQVVTPEALKNSEIGTMLPMAELPEGEPVPHMPRFRVTSSMPSLQADSTSQNGHQNAQFTQDRKCGILRQRAFSCPSLQNAPMISINKLPALAMRGTEQHERCAEPEPETELPSTPVQPIPVPRDSPNIESAKPVRSYRLEDVIHSPYDPVRDFVKLSGKLRMQKDARTGWLASFRPESSMQRERLRLAAASLRGQNFVFELNGLKLQWWQSEETRACCDPLGEIRINPQVQIAACKSLTNVIHIPGEAFLCAPTPHEAIDWLLALTFNCKSAQLALRMVEDEKFNSIPRQPDHREVVSATDLANDAVEHRNSIRVRTDCVSSKPVQNFDGNLHSPEISDLILAVEVERAENWDASSDGLKIWQAMRGGEGNEVFVRLEESMSISSGGASPHSRRQWHTVHQTEPLSPEEPKDSQSDRRLVCFRVMLVLRTDDDLPVDAGLRSRDIGVHARRYRVQLCRQSDRRPIGKYMELDIDELQLKNNSISMLGAPRAVVQRIDTHNIGAQNSTDASVGVLLKVYPYETYLMGSKLPQMEKFCGSRQVLQQSYMLSSPPVCQTMPASVSSSTIDVAAWTDIIAADSTSSHDQDHMLNPRNIVREEIRLPKCCLEVPLHFVYLRRRQMCEKLVQDIQRVKALATHRSDGATNVLLTQSSELYAQLKQLQIQLQRAVVVLPWYSRCYDFYLGLYTRWQAEGKAFFKSSQLKRIYPLASFFYDQWAFMSTNMCEQRTSIQSCEGDSLESDKRVFTGITVGCPAAHCFAFGNGGLCSLDKILKVEQQKIDDSQNGVKTVEQMETARLSHSRSSVSEAIQVEPDHITSQTIENLKSQIQLRLDVVLSQVLSVVVAAFIATIEAAYTRTLSNEKAQPRNRAVEDHAARCLQTLQSTGTFWIEWESLLSTRGKELGMMEDIWYVTTEPNGLPGIQLQCLKAQTNSCIAIHRMPQNGFSSAAHTVVKIGLAPECFAMLPPRLLSGNVESVDVSAPFQVMALLFTQGINEQQSLAFSITGDGAELQERVNSSSIQRAQAESVQLMSEASSVGKVVGCNVNTLELQQALDSVQEAVERAAGSGRKHPQILQRAAHWALLVGAARVTMCKSGKDRTAMSVTLEQYKALSQHVGQDSLLPTNQPNCYLNVIRSNGVRRENARLNTGLDIFAFNILQQGFLPEEYRPPLGSFGANKS